MRLILSRKGFDSSAGGKPSPIFADGSLLSLPIPERDSGRTYGELAWRGGPLASLIEQLTEGGIPAHYGVHLDPDLRAETVPRDPGWLPSLGQVGAAQKVLERESVGPGDIFLFFGWFREVEEQGGRFRYVPRAPNLHVIHGWLQIGQVFSIPHDRTPDWAARNPHVVRPRRKSNTLYVAAEQLRLGGEIVGLPGAGFFAEYDERLRLTAPGEKRRSEWELPMWFHPRDDRNALGYHGDAGRWRVNDDRLFLRSAARGQEFVLDLDSYPEALPWLRSLLDLEQGLGRCSTKWPRGFED